MNSCKRFILDIPRGVHILQQYVKLRWLFPSTWRQYSLGTILHQTTSTKSSPYMYNLLKSSIHSPSPHTLPSHLYPPSHKTSSFDSSFLSELPPSALPLLTLSCTRSVIPPLYLFLNSVSSLTSFPPQLILYKF